MGGFYSIDWIRGTSGWKTYSISIICPPEAVKVKIGAILYGKGKAWFRDYEVKFTSLDNRQPSKLAIEYITAVCDTIRKHSLVRDSINLSLLKETALKIAGPAKKYEDCHLAVNYLLESLRPFGDEHSFFMKAKEVENWKTEGSQVNKVQYPSYKMIDAFGYILVPPFHGGNPKQMTAYTDSLQTAIRNLYNSGAKGWIIDLRENTGGNMAPMIPGLGPLFSSEKLGSLVNVEGKYNSWYYKEGKYYWDDEAVSVMRNPFTLPRSLPIAVLIGHQTGSSGEAVTVSFIGNEKTKLFGQPTWGLTTGNGSFDLKDGSQIFLASTIMADRNGNLYRSSINPDYIIENGVDGGLEKIISAAINWLKKE